MDNFDPYNVLLAIASNIPKRLKTAFVLQDHKCVMKNQQHSDWCKAAVHNNAHLARHTHFSSQSQSGVDYLQTGVSKVIHCITHFRKNNRSTCNYF